MPILLLSRFVAAKSTKELVDLAFISSKTNCSFVELAVPQEVEYSTGVTLAAEVVEEARQPVVDAA